MEINQLTWTIYIRIYKKTANHSRKGMLPQTIETVITVAQASTFVGIFHSCMRLNPSNMRVKNDVIANFF